MNIRVFDEELKLAIEYWQREYDDAWRIIDRFEVPEDREKRGVFFTALYAMREVLARREGCEHCVVNDWERKPLATWETSFDNCTTEKHEMHIEGYTVSPAMKDLSNMQVLGFESGESKSDAIQKFLKSNEWVQAHGFSVDEMCAIKVFNPESHIGFLISCLESATKSETQDKMIDDVFWALMTYLADRDAGGFEPTINGLMTQIREALNNGLL